ncbi:MAG: hypothetical protein AB1480_08130 [Nitrospirota bacterium]
MYTVEEPRPEQLKPEEEIPQDTKIDEDKGPKKPGEDYADTWVKSKFVRYVFVIIILAIGYFIYTKFNTTPVITVKKDREPSKTINIPSKKSPPKKVNLPTSDDRLVKQTINDFVSNYLRDSSGENLDALLTYYDERVNYYAKGWVNKKFIYSDKKAYFKRWPHRTYDLVSDIKISDSNESSSSKVVQFTYDFHVWNDNKTIKGQAENTFKLRSNNDAWHITDEKQNVINRDSF